MRKIYPFLVVLLLLSGCAKLSEEKRAQKAREYYSEGLRAFREGDYGDAAWNFGEALKFMDWLTPSQIENAKFLLGKSHYLDKNFVEAVVALEDYIFYYPKLHRTQEAYYMLVDSYIKVSPDPYRDQEYTWKAIEKAKEFLSKFPGSPYAQKIKNLIDTAYVKIAKHEYLIAKFYEDYGYTYSAALRYRDLLINFPGYVSEKEVAYRYIRSMILVEKQVRLVKDRLNDLIEKAESKLKKARGEGEKIAIKKRIEFLNREIERWENIKRKAREDVKEALSRYKEVYGENPYYRELIRLLSEKGWKS